MPMYYLLCIFLCTIEITTVDNFNKDCVPRNFVDSSSSGFVMFSIVRQVYWSKNAVVCLRDGVMCLVWRFVDIQQSQLLETHFRAQIRSTYVTQEGEVFNNYMRWVVG